MASENWLGDIATLGLTKVAAEREFAIVIMDGKGRTWLHDKTYTDHRVAAGQATRIENASRGDGFLRGYLVVRLGERAFVFSGTNTILWRSPDGGAR